MNVYRGLTMRTAGGVLRTATYKNREHLVVPVVALVEGVVQSINAEHPEFVPASAFEGTARAWNGQPAVYDHPSVNGQQVPANEPEILDAVQLGQVFHTQTANNELRMEAWIDGDRAKVVGSDAEQLFAALQKGETVEVSVGVFVTLSDEAGEHNGKKYQGKWLSIVPDHLALLPLGMTGACSNAAGCGAGVARSAAAGGPMAEEIKPVQQTLRQRLLSMVKNVFSVNKTAEDMSDSDLRRALDAKLRDTVPAYAGIDAVYPVDSLVVYSVSKSDAWSMFQQKYEMASDGAVSLSGDAQEVELKVTYEPLSAGQAPVPATLRAACGCEQPTGERVMHKNASRITALIANPKTVWSEHDRAHLETLEDTRLAALEQHAAEQEPKPETPPPPKVEVKLEDLPKPWQDAINAAAVTAASAKTAAVTALAAAQGVYTQAELEGMTVEQLTKLQTLMGVQPQTTDFTARAASTVPARPGVQDFTSPPPIDMNARVLAARKAH